MQHLFYIFFYYRGNLDDFFMGLFYLNIPNNLEYPNGKGEKNFPVYWTFYCLSMQIFRLIKHPRFNNSLIYIISVVLRIYKNIFYV